MMLQPLSNASRRDSIFAALALAYWQCRAIANLSLNPIERDNAPQRLGCNGRIATTYNRGGSGSSKMPASLRRQRGRH